MANCLFSLRCGQQCRSINNSSASSFLFAEIPVKYILEQACIARQRKSHLYIPRKGIVRPQSRFPHSCVCACERFYSRIGPCIFLQQNRQTVVGIYNRSQTHKCGNCDCGRPLPFLGIFVSNYLYCVFAVCRVFQLLNQGTTVNYWANSLDVAIMLSIIIIIHIFVFICALMAPLSLTKHLSLPHKGIIGC